MTILRFDHPAELGRYMQDAAKRDSGHPLGFMSYWRTEDYQKCFTQAITGDRALVPEAEKLMAQVSAQLPTVDRVPVMDMAGAYPMVPSFLANDPLCMRRRAYQTNESAPVHFYFGISPNAAVTRTQIRQYGIAILALVWTLSLSRPITLHTIEYSHPGSNEKHKRDNAEVITVCRVPTDPIDLAVACHVLTSPSYARNVCFEVATAAGGNGSGYPFGYSDQLDSPFMKGLRKRLELDDEAVIFPSLHDNSQAIRDPVGWINQHLAKYVAETE